MILFDSHCHLDDKAFSKDFDDVLDRMDKAGVEAAMIAGIDRRTSETAVRLAETHEQLYAGVGFHPHDVKSANDKALARLVELAGSPKVKAWGEIGLDFNRMFSPQDVQEKWFETQVDVSGELGLPVIFHERESKGRFLEILKARFSPGRKGVVHCFTGNRSELFAYLDLGLYIGITGILTIKARGEQLRELAPLVPEDRLLIETDAPYLIPAPERNKHRRNEPAFVKSVLLRLAEVRNTEAERLSQAIYDNTLTLFNI